MAKVTKASIMNKLCKDAHSDHHVKLGRAHAITSDFCQDRKPRWSLLIIIKMLPSLHVLLCEWWCPIWNNHKQWGVVCVCVGGGGGRWGDKSDILWPMLKSINFHTHFPFLSKSPVNFNMATGNYFVRTSWSTAMQNFKDLTQNKI